FSLRRRPYHLCCRWPEAAFGPPADFDISPGHLLSVAVPSLRCDFTRVCFPGICPALQGRERSCAMAENPAVTKKQEWRAAGRRLWKRFLTALMRALAIAHG